MISPFGSFGLRDVCTVLGRAGFGGKKLSAEARSEHGPFRAGAERLSSAPRRHSMEKGVLGWLFVDFLGLITGTVPDCKARRECAGPWEFQQSDGGHSKR